MQTHSADYFDPNALAMVKIGNNSPSAKNPIAAATKHKMTGSINRTA